MGTETQKLKDVPFTRPRLSFPPGNCAGISENTIKIVTSAKAGDATHREYPDLTENTGFRVALRLHGTCDLKGYDKQVITTRTRRWESKISGFKRALIFQRLAASLPALNINHPSVFMVSVYLHSIFHKIFS